MADKLRYRLDEWCLVLSRPVPACPIARLDNEKRDKRRRIANPLTIRFSATQGASLTLARTLAMWAAQVRSRNEAPDLEEQQGLEIGKGVYVIGDYWQLFFVATEGETATPEQGKGLEASICDRGKIGEAALLYLK